MTRPIRIAAQIPPAGTPSYSAWRDAILRAEDIGADAIFGYDHFMVPAVTGRDENGRPVTAPNPPVRSNFESWTALASWAEITSRAELGLLVGGAGFRNPDLLADMARTVDHISGGRIILGLGAGWYQPDYTEYSYDFGAVSSRHALFVDALERIQDRLTKLVPPPLRKIPVLIGGGGEKKTLRMVAQYAQACNLFGGPDLAHKLEVLRGHCDALGRDYDEIEKTVMFPIDPGENGENVDSILEKLREFAALGVSHAHSRCPAKNTIPAIELIGERIIPEAEKF